MTFEDSSGPTRGARPCNQKLTGAEFGRVLRDETPRGPGNADGSYTAREPAARGQQSKQRAQLGSRLDQRPFGALGDRGRRHSLKGRRSWKVEPRERRPPRARIASTSARLCARMGLSSPRRV
jgi:hypothetical protein